MFNIIKNIKSCPNYNKTGKIILSLRFLESPVWWPYAQSVCPCNHYVCQVCTVSDQTQYICIYVLNVYTNR